MLLAIANNLIKVWLDAIRSYVRHQVVEKYWADFFLGIKFPLRNLDVTSAKPSQNPFDSYP